MNAITRQTPDMKTIAGTLAEWLSGLDEKSIPDTARDASRRALIDVVGVIHAGIDMPLAQIVREEALAESSAGRATLIGSANKLPAPVAARVNATAAHVLDFDANFNRGMVFGPAILLPALLASAETENLDGASLLSAFAVGTEVCRILAQCLTPAPYRKDRDSLFYNGWFNTAVLGPIGVAAAISWALKLPRDATLNSLSIAAVQSGGLRIGVGSDMKPLLAARAAETGMRAAYLARKGVLAPDNVFEGKRGFVEVINKGQWTNGVLETVGSFEDAGASLKLYPACSSVQAAAEALVTVLHENNLSRQDVESLICDVTSHIASNLAFDNPKNVTQAQFSISYALACILADGDFTYRHLTAEMLTASHIRAEMPKVQMRDALRFEDEAVAREYPEATRIVVNTFYGRSFTLQKNASTGKPINPMSDQLLEKKFLNNTLDRLGAQKAKQLLEGLKKIDTVLSPGTLFNIGEAE